MLEANTKSAHGHRGRPHRISERADVPVHELDHRRLQPHNETTKSTYRRSSDPGRLPPATATRSGRSQSRESIGGMYITSGPGSKGRGQQGRGQGQSKPIASKSAWQNTAQPRMAT